MLVDVLDVNSLYPPTAGQTCVAGVTYATVRATQSGQYAISGTLGPNGSPTFCPNDKLVAIAYGFDYDELLAQTWRTITSSGFARRYDDLSAVRADQRRRRHGS